MFDMQQHDNPSSRNRTLRELVWILLATVTPPVHALPTGSSPFTLGAGAALGRTSSMEFGGPVRSGSGRFGSCLHYEIIRISSSWIDPASVNGLLETNSCDTLKYERFQLPTEYGLTAFQHR